MIRISIGNIGSGKTACEVREMALNQHMKNYTNIVTSLPNNIQMNSDMICTRQVIGGNKKGEPVYDLSLNVDFWKNIKEPINVIMDEAHSILNSRRSMSKINIIVTDWVALIRRVLGEDSRGVGDLVLISQLPQRLDVICREMATQVRYHCCHYTKICNKCGAGWDEDTDMPEIAKKCIFCASTDLTRKNFRIEIKLFQNMNAYTAWKIMGMNTFYKHYFITDIEKYFPMYNTLQWENMFSNLYY